MVKMTRKLAVCLLLGLGLTSLGAYSNSLTQLDIKKSVSSDSTLNVTIYTSSPYDENVAVSKKADNKYVIIMPDVSGVTGEKPDLSGLHDVISDIDVKSVQADENGYTKVTLTTTKPVTIKTLTKRSAPLTAEQKAYKNLIAQSRATKPVSSTNSPKTYSVPSATLKFDNTEPSKPKVQQKSVEKPLVSSKPIDIEPEVKKENIVKAAQNKIKDTVKLVTEKKAISQDVNADLEKHVPSVFKEDIKLTDKNTVEQTSKTDAASSSKEENKSVEQPATPFKNIVKERPAIHIPANLLTLLGILLGSALGLYFLFKLIKKSLEHSTLLKESFKENLLSKPLEVETYDDIVNDKELSWQEKYQKYIDNSKTKSQEPSRRILKHIGNGEYKFVNEAEPQKPQRKIQEEKKDSAVQTGKSEVISDITSAAAQLKPKQANKLKSYNKTARNSSPEDIPPIKKVKNQNLKPERAPKLTIVEDDYKDLAESLEKSLHETPDIELFEINEETLLKQMQNNLQTTPVVSETDKIAESMHKTKKLKSFADKLALEKTRRDMPLPKGRSEIRKVGNVESKHVELGNSPLHTNSRKFEGANLSVGDLIAKSDKFLNAKSENTPMARPSRKEQYSTVSLDEFFDKIDYSSSATAPSSLASRVADSLGKMTIENNIKKIKEQAVTKHNPFDGLVVLSGYNITDDSGFYVVRNSDRETSLIGRVNNDIIKIKDFGNEQNVRLQVRPDSPNVYMVKANGSRYLVEINNDKMAVLLEL